MYDCMMHYSIIIYTDRQIVFKEIKKKYNQICEYLKLFKNTLMD